MQNHQCKEPLNQASIDVSLQQELYIVFRHVHALLSQRSVIVDRQLVGNYVTSLDMAGCIVTLLRFDPELLDLWDAPVQTPALRW